MSEKLNHIYTFQETTNDSQVLRAQVLLTVSSLNPHLSHSSCRLRHVTESVFLYTSFVVDDINTLCRSEDYGKDKNEIMQTVLGE